MRNQGLGSWPIRRGRMTPHRIALASDDGQIDYRRLADRTARCAQLLRSRGVRRGDRVAYLGPNDPTFFDVLFGTSTLGAIMVPINTRLAPPEVSYVLTDSGASVVIVAPTHAQILATAQHDLPSSRVIPLTDDTPGPGPSAPIDTAALSTFDDLLDAADPDWIDEPIELDDVAVIMYTSGTTGRPKGAMLTHGNLTWNAFNVLIDLDLHHDDVSLVCAPLFHIAALSMIALPTLVKGGTIRLQAGFDPATVLSVIEREGITQMFGVPTMFNAMANTEGWASTDLSSLRSVMCGGAPVPKATIETYLGRGVVFLQGYGMTETAPGLLFLDGAGAVPKAGSAGVPSFFTDVRLVRPDMAEVEPGERGEILASGANVMKGYWGRPDATASSFSEGDWFHTGDVATVDDDGYFTIVDRVKDIIISGGENVYPAEVEDALLYHPAVVECAVIGVPHPDWGEVGRAVVVVRPDASVDPEELLSFLDGRLARYKIPKSVVFAEELPKSGAGKVLKQVLRRSLGGSAP